MIDKAPTSITGAKTWRDFLFMVIIGTCLGILGGVADEVAGSLIGAILLLGLFGAYNNVLEGNRGMMSGLVAGGISGIIVGQIGLLLGGLPGTPVSAALFGLVRGMLLGAVVGLLTRARPDEGDSSGVALFLVFGSIVVGAFLGAGVGLAAGLTLSIVGLSWWGTIVALLLGVVIGGYLGSYFQARRAVFSGAALFGLLSFGSAFVGGAFEGLVIGLLAGALTPMLVVAMIGFSGGLTSRGFKAGLEEAVEAPEEMIQQGAVPFLAPAMVLGVIVGAVASGEGGLLALAVTLALTGMILGVITEIERRQTNRLTIRRLIEMIMLGSDRWPLLEMVAKVSGKNWRAAVIGAAIGLVLGGVGAAVGGLIGQQVRLWFNALI